MIAFAGQIVAIRLECREKLIVRTDVTKIATGSSRCSANEKFNSPSAGSAPPAGAGVRNCTSCVPADIGECHPAGTSRSIRPDRLPNRSTILFYASAGRGGNQAWTDETLQAAGLRMQGRPVIERQIDHDEARGGQFFVELFARLHVARGNQL